MPTSDFQLTDDKYETKLWISKEFIEKYPQFPFYDIIQHSDKYEDNSYYIDIPSSPMNKVVVFLMKENMDIDSLNLKDSYDIYRILIEYSVKIDNDIKSYLLIHIKELFYKYLDDNNYDICRYGNDCIKPCMSMELFNLKEKEIRSNGLFTPQRKEELLYYSLLFKMMNITKVEITYDYSSNIPLEYICPSCIKDIFPSLKEFTINVTTHYKETELLLNPNSDEYIMEYNRLFYKYDYEIENLEEYEYYTESEMNEYNKISSLDLNKFYYSHELIDSYSERRENYQLPKLYKYVINEDIYTNDYSNVEISTTEDKYRLYDIVRIKYDDKTNDKTFIINQVSSKHGISQLLLLPSYLCISNISFNADINYQSDSMVFMRLFEEGVFDSLTSLNARCQKLINEIDENIFNKIMTTHIFPNVTELIYDNYDDIDDSDNDDYNDESFQLSLIKKECFPKLHIITYDITITTKNFDSLFPVNLMSMIDTIRIHYIVDSYEKEEIALRLDELVYTHSIIIDITNICKCDDWMNYFPHLRELIKKNLIIFDYLYIDSSRSENIKLLDSIEDYKQNIDSLNITFKSDRHDKIDKRNALERFLKSYLLEHLNQLNIWFYENISIEYLTWISTLFNDNKFNNIHQVKIHLYYINEDSSSVYLTAYENIVEKLISKASNVDIYFCYMSFINRLIPKGCFHNTIRVILYINDIPDDNFCKLYTKDNFPQLKSIKFYKDDKEWWSSFIKIFCEYMNNNNFPSAKWYDDNYDDYVYDPSNYLFRCKYDSNSFIDTIIGTHDEKMSKFEIETLFDYIYDEEQLIKLINFITNGKFPKLKEFFFIINYHISYEQIDIYNQQLKDLLFIQENQVNYTLDKI
ncbi:hypothetical protein WA158_004766 [Blastocystis sp. Blastoise]